MRGFLRVLLAFVLALAAMLVALYLWIGATKVPTYSLTPVSLSVEPTPVLVAEGRRIAEVLCTECHRDPTTEKLAGRLLTDVPASLGRFHSANITRDRVHGIGDWTDGDLARLLRTGVRRDGRFIVIMPQFNRLADEDLAALIAYLRSDATELSPVEVTQPPAEPAWLGKAVLRFMLKPATYPTSPIPAPDRSDAVAWGRYLVRDKFDCSGCHTNNFAPDPINPERTKGYMQGGFELIGPGGEPLLSSNLSPDDETGIGRWSLDDFSRAMKNGARPDHTPIRPPMPRFRQLTDEEIAAMYAYLRGLPAAHNPVPRPELPPLPDTADLGQKLYAKYECATCHGEDGKGDNDLTGAATKWATDEEIAAYIKNPSRFVPDTQMPEWEGVIAEEEFLPLAAYVRRLGGGR
ncbi:MAG: c-type cytochrome [Candidatus Eisenbacteria bacterium]|nr:c-type cytochrome [Candidatus Eisenbacteria bacterium]